MNPAGRSASGEPDFRVEQPPSAAGAKSVEFRSHADALSIAIVPGSDLSAASFARVLIAAQSQARTEGLVAVECNPQGQAQRHLARRLGFKEQAGEDSLHFDLSPQIVDEIGLFRLDAVVSERSAGAIRIAWSTNDEASPGLSGVSVHVVDKLVGEFNVDIPIDGTVTEDGVAQVVIGARDLAQMLGRRAFDSVALVAPPSTHNQQVELGLSFPDGNLLMIHPALAGGLQSPIDHLIAAEAAGYVASSDLSPLLAVLAHEVWHITEASQLAAYPERLEGFWQALRVEVLEEVVGIRPEIARHAPWAELLAQPALAHVVSRRATQSPSELTAELWVAGHSMDPPDIATAFLSVAHRLTRP